MKYKNYSLFSVFLIILISVSIRFYYIQNAPKENSFRLTTYDAFGYYMYLPAIFIYDDASQLQWLPAIDSQYAVIGGWQYQTIKKKDGDHVFKYLGGVALLELPFFMIGHIFCYLTPFPTDGFSLPYQYALVASAFFYALFGLIMLRRFLLYYFDDKIVALTLILLTLSTNWIQYVALDSAMSHVYIFPLYSAILLLSRAWHEKPSSKIAFLIGLVIGIATICRPTEGIMLFIPLLWNTHNKETATLKWQQVKKYKNHVWIAILSGLLAVSPQLIYWKITSGSFLYDTGSKWYFLNPYFRVLFGFEKGWFVYTPITILFILGMFFMKDFPFRKSVIVFCILNLWIITAWADWHYGASYSCRALVQSYPVFAMPLAILINKIVVTRWKSMFFALCLYLILVNLFQVYQYNAGIIRFDENSFEYYKSIYLNFKAKPFVR
jgi:hypothetical protein